MHPTIRRSGLALLLGLGLCTAAQADMVYSLGTLSAPASTAFSNSSVHAGTVSGVYNFLDQFSFTLAPLANLSAISAAIDFTDGNGNVLLGVSNLQMKLTSGAATLVSWQTASTPAPGLNQVISVIPSTQLQAGGYTLQVRGTVNEPGAYSGSLIASPVPLPASMPLLMVGIGMLVFSRRALRERS